MQVIVALSGEATTYSAEPNKAAPEPPALPVGGGAALVSLVQVGGRGTLGLTWKVIQQREFAATHPATSNYYHCTVTETADAGCWLRSQAADADGWL